MKRHCLPVLTILAISLLTLAASAATTTHTYYFGQPRVEAQNGVTMVVVDGAMTTGCVGAPLLPHAPVKLLLPPGEEAVSISFTAADPVLLGDGYLISHRMQPYPLSLGDRAEMTPRDEGIYTADAHYPSELTADLQTQFMSGHGISYAVVYPVTYNPVTGELLYYSWVKVTIETESTQKAMEAHGNMLSRTKAAQERLAGMVQNPEVSTIYGAQAPADPEGFDLLVISTTQFAPLYEEYVNFKIRSGYLTEVKTVSDIYATYPGADNQEKIRNCIIDYYTNHGITYVFICGDDEHVPDRPLYCNAGYTDHLPGDLYYSGLDGNWNNDGDGNWGEPGEEDFIGEVFVGRSCADTQAEIANFINKSLLYQTAPVADELEIALMTGEDLGWPIWAWEYKEEIRFGSSNYGYTTVGFPPNFQVGTLYEVPGYSWSAMSDLLPLLNMGPNLVNHLGHANYDYVMQFYTNQITDVNFTNNGVNHNFFIGYSQGCMCGGFDNGDCILEAFTTIANGAVAFIGNSRYGWGDLSTTNGPSQHFDRQFFDAIFAEDITNIGWANQDSKEENIWLIPGDNVIRWCYYELNVFGDPTLDIWTAEPGTFYPTYNAVALLGSQTFQVSGVTDGALVTISQDNVMLGRGAANASGVALVTFDGPLQTLGMLDIMVTQHDMLPYEGEIQVIPPAGPYVIFNSCVVEDAITGNGNGQLDYAESVELTTTVENVGVENASNVNLTLTCDDPLVTITDGDEYLGAITAGATSTLNNAFAFGIAPEVEDDYGVQFMLTAADGVNTWESYFVIVAHAPVGAYVSNYILDPLGNNNHNLDPGEEGDIEVTVMNDGSCFVDDLTITLSTTDPYVTPAWDFAALGTLLPGEQGTGTLAIAASASCPQEHVATITVNFTGSNGFTDTDDFQLTVGDILYNPTGPDAYGYTAYDPFDAPEMPVYDWIEICADSGGLGTQLAFTLDDQVLLNLLPFSFQYYGIDYDTLSVGANGWIAPGRITEDDYSNSGIPNSDGPERMIAPYWEDLSPQRPESGGVWTWYDAANHLYIVEWNHVEQYAPTGSFETFQVILYDPAYHQTNTGDGRIKFQYKDMSGTAQTEGTIGIENHAETVGLQILYDGAYDQYVHAMEDGYALLFSTMTFAPQISVDLTYVSGSPIPVGGGNLYFEVFVDNYGTVALNFDAWLDVSYEGGAPTTVVQRSFTSFQAGWQINRPDMFFPVPAAYAGGNYAMLGRLGSYPGDVWVEDSFAWSKDGATSGEFVPFVPQAFYPNPFDRITTGGEGELTQALPEEYSLGQNYPNPFNPSTTINFSLPEAQHVKLTVFNVNGQVVASLVDGMRDAAQYEVTWDASDVASGLYFYQLEAGDFSSVKKMVLVK
ncbi:T9SS type A sorting domain-containing protein [bacterium]|nr:T9SS type A sorting domain-containing protein [bacterium]